MSPAEISALAAGLGITLTANELIAYAPESDGLSGGVSWLYSLRGKLISCHWAGVAHDCLYERGGTAAERKLADKLFRLACCRSGKPVPGWLARMRGEFAKTALLFCWLPPLRRGWRCARAWVMYGAVRLFGGGKRHWNSAGKPAPAR